MAEWWNALDMFQKVLYCIAIPSTLVLVIQTILVLCGFGDGGEGINYSDTSGIDFDTDMSADVSDIPSVDDIGDISNADVHNMGHEGSNPIDAGNLRMFTIQTIMAFLCVFGWTSIVMYGGDHLPLSSALLGAVFGVIAMYGIAKIAQQSVKLAENGSFNPRNALGVEGNVYLTIPPAGCGNGKITLVVQGGLMECDAMTEDANGIPTGEKIRVVDIVGDTLVVERVR